MKNAIALALIVLSTVAQAQTPGDAFLRGGEFYRAGRYDRAAGEYEAILHQGYVSAEVYFNLGNAYYRQNKLGAAILAYERAARLHPGDADIQHNLRLANLRTIDRIEPVPELFLIQWMRRVASVLTPQAALLLFLSGWCVLFLSLALLYALARPPIVRTTRIAALAGLIVVLAGGAILLLQRIQDSSHDEAIVVASVATAKSSPDDRSVDAFVVHEGLKVRMSDAVGGWVKITLPDGKVGWIVSDQCQRI